MYYKLLDPSAVSLTALTSRSTVFRRKRKQYLLYTCSIDISTYKRNVFCRERKMHVNFTACMINNLRNCLGEWKNLVTKCYRNISSMCSIRHNQTALAKNYQKMRYMYTNKGMKSFLFHKYCHGLELLEWW